MKKKTLAEVWYNLPENVISTDKQATKRNTIAETFTIVFCKARILFQESRMLKELCAKEEKLQKCTLVLLIKLVLYVSFDILTALK